MKCKKYLFIKIITALFALLITPIGNAGAADNSIIIGLLQKQTIEKKALENTLNHKLIDAKSIYDQTLMKHNIVYSRSLNGLNNEYIDKRIDLVKRNGDKKSYPEEIKKLEKKYEKGAAFFLKAHREIEQSIYHEYIGKKGKISQEHRPDQYALKGRHSTERNRLKEKHAKNKSILLLEHKPQINKRNEIFSRLRSAINEDYNSSRENLRFEHNQKSYQKIPQNQKNHLNLIFQVESSQLSVKRNGIYQTREYEKNLEKLKLQKMQNIQLEALRAIHFIELNGGTLQEYGVMKNVLSDFDLVYSYDYKANEISSTISTEKSSKNANIQELERKLDSYIKPDGSHVFFSPQDDSPNWLNGQCVEGAKKLYNVVSAIKINESIGSAANIHESDFVKKNNIQIVTDHTKPVVGAMIVWTNVNSASGHVGVITNINDETITVYDSNYGVGGTQNFAEWGLDSQAAAGKELVTDNYGKYTQKTFKYQTKDQLQISGSNYVFSKYIYPKE